MTSFDNNANQVPPEKHFHPCGFHLCGLLCNWRNLKVLRNALKHPKTVSRHSKFRHFSFNCMCKQICTTFFKITYPKTDGKSPWKIVELEVNLKRVPSCTSLFQKNFQHFWNSYFLERHGWLPERFQSLIFFRKFL